MALAASVGVTIGSTESLPVEVQRGLPPHRPMLHSHRHL